MQFYLDSANKEEKQAFIAKASQGPQAPLQTGQRQIPHVNVVFCIPGREFTSNFLNSWTNLIGALYHNKVSFCLSNAYSPVVYYARSACLRGHVLRGRKQKPFNGEMTYDYLMWIDSDIVFSPEHFFKLLEKMQKHPDVQLMAGTYLMADGKHTTIVDTWDEEYFAERGSFKFLTMPEVKAKSELAEVKAKDNLFECVYCGFGWLMVRYGVHESFEYPFFKPQFHELKGGEIYDFSSEDASFFLDLREKGIKCYVDPDINVGHEKHVVLQ